MNGFQCHSKVALTIKNQRDKTESDHQRKKSVIEMNLLRVKLLLYLHGPWKTHPMKTCPRNSQHKNLLGKIWAKITFSLKVFLKTQ